MDHVMEIAMAILKAGEVLSDVDHSSFHQPATEADLPPLPFHHGLHRSGREILPFELSALGLVLDLGQLFVGRTTYTTNHGGELMVVGRIVGP